MQSERDRRERSLALLSKIGTQSFNSKIYILRSRGLGCEGTTPPHIPVILLKLIISPQARLQHIHTPLLSHSNGI
jgi:hypothetical protein